MDRLIMKADDTVDTFLAKWNKLNIKLGCHKNSRPAVTEFCNTAPRIPRLDEAAKQLAREQDLCFRCRKPGH